MVDVHAHLYTPQLADDLDAIIERFTQASGRYIINSATDPESCHDVISQAQKHDQILPSLGLHPELLVPGADIYIPTADEKWIDKQIEAIDQLLHKHDEIIAIGECGLDYYWIKHERLGTQVGSQIKSQAGSQTGGQTKLYDIQKHLFKRNIELAKQHDLPMVIHCRDEMGDKQCEAEILELLVKTGNSKIHGVFHSYTGSLSYLEDILALGFYISFNGIVTYKNADNVREILDATPDDRLLIETDAPYLVPQKRRSAGVKVCEPLFVDEIAAYIAKHRGTTTEQLWRTVEANAGKLFNLPT